MADSGGDVRDQDIPVSTPTEGASEQRHAGGRKASDIRTKAFEDQGQRCPKAKRTAAKCKYCSTVISAQEAKVDRLYKHIILECKGAQLTPELRLYWQQQQAGAAAHSTAGEDAAAAAAAASGRKRKSSSQQSSSNKQPRIDLVMGSKLTALPAAMQEQLNLGWVRWSASNNIPFRAFDSPHFAANLQLLRPGYQAPSSAMLRTTCSNRSSSTSC